MELCKCYADLCDEILQTRGEWRWDERQVNIAIDLLEQGITLQQFKKVVSRSLKWHGKEKRRPPYSLLFFKDAFKRKKEAGDMSAEELVADTIKGLRISKIYKT